mgnify:CR=1 FL=1
MADNISAALSSVPSGIMTSAQYKAQQEAAAAAKGNSMGQTEFLTLFTTQLKNQDPLDPVKNEAFVAQLASPSRGLGDVYKRQVMNLPVGADGIQVQVYNDKGVLVRNLIMGAQPPGDVTIAWDGKDMAGNNAPNGIYRYVATVNSKGQ